MPAEAASVLLTRLMAGLLYGVSAMDSLTFAVVAILLCAWPQSTKNIRPRQSYNRNPCVRNRCTMLRRSSAPILCFIRYK
jgi:hypothetical protein